MHEHSAAGSIPITRGRALTVLALITVVGAAFRFYHLDWGAPSYHFHIDEHFVTAPADAMRRSMKEAADSPKFFMYSPLPMYLINVVRAMYEWFGHTLDLKSPNDEVVYMVLTRGCSALFATATIPLAYICSTKVAGRLAGLIAAALLACAVLHIQDAHFAAEDIAVTCTAVLALWMSLRLVERGDWTSLVLCGVSFAIAILCRYSGAFVLGVVGVAYFLAPGRPERLQPIGAWVQWVLRGITPIAIAAVTFLLVDPLAWQYPAKFQDDIKTWVVDPLRGATKPLWVAQFADVHFPRLYWFTNLLWWGVGPALEVVGLAGLVWLIARRDRKAAVVASFPILYFISASGTIAPFIRYALPLTPALAIAAGVFCADVIGSRRWRALGLAIAGLTLVTTAAYAAAYLTIYAQPDSRLEASHYLLKVAPAGARVLVEPSQNVVPMGQYLTKPSFYEDYVPWRSKEYDDYFHIVSLDTYDFLYKAKDDQQKRDYIAAQLAKADWIVIDDTFLQFYQHLPEAQHGVVKQYYRDLFAGTLGFKLDKTFKVYPSLFHRMLDDDKAELTFRLFDHPRVFIFRRQTAAPAA